MGSLRLIFPWLGPYRTQAVAAIVSTIAVVAINIAIPLLTARIIDDGIAADSLTVVAQTTLIMIALVGVALIFSAFAAVLGVRVAFGVEADLREDLFRHIQTFSFSNLDEIETGQLLVRLTSDVTKIRQVFAFGLSILAQAPLAFVGSLLAMLALDLQMASIMLVLLPITSVITWYVASRSDVLYELVQSKLDRLNTVLRENLAGAQVVKAFVREHHEAARFDEVNTDLTEHAAEVNMLVSMLFPALLGVMNLGVAAVIWIGGNAVIEGRMTDGNLVAFINYLLATTFPIVMFAFIQPMLSAAGASARRINRVLATAPAVADSTDPQRPEHMKGHIRFEQVSFGYGGSEQVLEDINLDIPAGTTTAILGATGSGKSTLVNLIPRFYEVSRGSVSLDGIDIRNYSKDDLRRNIGVSLQSAVLFSGTIRDNIRYGRPTATHEEVEGAAKVAQAHNFIAALDDGYDSLVQQGGSNLSGGQRQRLAIARALLVDPKVLILDDSTSAVDVETEAHIQEAISELSGTRTIVLVAQRISTALGADEIVVLDEGRVVAVGPHADLITSSAIYRDIFRSQLGEPSEIAT